MELSGPKTPPGPSLCLKIVVAAVCGKANDPLTPLKRLQRNYLVMGIVRENVPSSIPFFSPFLTQNLTQNRKNWGGAESTQPPGFGLFQVTKPPENVEPQQMDKPTAAHNPEVGGSSPPRNQQAAEIAWFQRLSSFFITFRMVLFLLSCFDPDCDPYGKF